jgi:hypothetical protein
MTIKVSIEVDVDTTDKDIEDMRDALVECALLTLEQNPEFAVLEPVEP